MLTSIPNVAADVTMCTPAHSTREPRKSRTTRGRSVISGARSQKSDANRGDHRASDQHRAGEHPDEHDRGRDRLDEVRERAAADDPDERFCTLMPIVASSKMEGIATRGRRRAIAM